MKIFLEALDPRPDGIGLKWRVRVIKAGQSHNRNYYPNRVLRESAPLFSGARVFAKSDLEHLQGKGKDFRNLVGALSNPQFIEGQGRDGGEIQATLTFLKAASPVPEKVHEIHESGMTGLFGFSIDAAGEVIPRNGLREAQRITKVNSLDLIMDPSAGGELIGLLEAKNDSIEEDNAVKVTERMIEAIKKANDGKLPDGLDTDNEESLLEAYQATFKPVKTDPDPVPAKPGVDEIRLTEAMAMIEAKAHLRAAVAESGLPTKAKDRVKAQFAKRERFTEADVDEAIQGEKDYLASFVESGHVTGLGDFVQAGEAKGDKIKQMWDDFFDPKKPAMSLREAYVDTTGDRHITGRFRECDQRLLREAAGAYDFREAISSTTFAEILGDSITRRMVAEYNTPSRYDVWRRLITRPVNLRDFRTNRRARLGGYGDLPTVAENGPYTAASSPGDEEATYAPTKRGYKETISIETIANDDMGVVQRIPMKMANAARRTLAKFMLDFMKDNGNIYDAVALFAAGHNNLGAAALSATTLAAGRLAMLKQTEADSSDRLGIPPVNLWVPADLEETAFDLFRRQTNNDTDFVESLQMNVVPVWYWTDTNNWYLTADPMDIPLMELGFLNGREEPEIFVQDNPTQGSLFSNDQVVYKIRHIYGGAVLDYRGFYGAVVA